MKSMELILTHENADFDAVASQLAAHKLYPDTVPLLSRRINRNVEQFLTFYWSALPFVRPDEWRKKKIERLLLVDTQTPLSVRGVVRDPQVRVIDHHVDHQRRPEWGYQVEPVGATTTLLVEKLSQAGFSLAPEEASLLLLGIYEDTGSLTYDTTTGRDVRAAAWLLEQSAQLAVVRRFLNVSLTPAQKALYDDLQSAAEWIEVKGREILVAAAAAPEDFDDEISSIVHRLRDALLPEGLFVLVQLNRDVQLVARSTDDGVDVSVVATAMGGGGHKRAAAALITKIELDEAKARLRDLLPRAVQPPAKVAQIMSYGVQTVSPEMKVADAETLMQRFGYEGYPVVDQEKGKLVGLLTRRAVDRAVSHDLARFPVRRVMKAGSVTVRPSDSIERVQKLMLDEGWGQIPVVSEEGEEGGLPLLGIVTRTDLLNHLFQPADEEAAPDMRRLLVQHLSHPMWKMVLAASVQADELGMPLYFVGGLVRDLLLDQPPKDLDMVVEGDAIKLARRLQAQYGGQLHTHRRFGTAKWFTEVDVWTAVHEDAAVEEQAETDLPSPDLLTDSVEDLPPTIDFVTARTEFYREPSALPEVEQGSIKLDLHRRDFTINTLAVRLDGAHLGELLDFYGGQRDLDQGLIRVLHSLSFIDDPTRILRAARLAQRLDFRIEARTAELLQDSLSVLDQVTGDRVRHEIELALREADPAAIMARMDELGVWEQLHPQLGWEEKMAVCFRRAPQVLADGRWRAALRGESPVFIYFALWMAAHPLPAQEAVMRRLKVRKETHQHVLAVTRLAEALEEVGEAARPSQVERVLRPFPPRVLLVGRIAWADKPAATLLSRYYHEWRHVKTAVDGNDLQEMGLEPGPKFAQWLDRLLAARLDGEVETRQEEMELVRQMVAK